MNRMTVRPSQVAGIAAIAAVIVGLLMVLWYFRTWLHGPVMLAYRYPLVTWVPVLLFIVLLAAAFAFSIWHERSSPERSRSYHAHGGSGDMVMGSGVCIAFAVTCLFWLAMVTFTSSWQGSALYQASEYTTVDRLPVSSQPRVLPKEAADAYGNEHNVKHAHLVISPSTGDLVWSGEEAPGGLFRSGASKAIATQSLSGVSGEITRHPGGFTPALSKVGISSLSWRAYRKHYLTNLQDRVIVPLPGGKQIAVIPYVGYKGFLVKRPYLKGIYVMHADGRLEDLSPEQAYARPELRASGRIFPEKLALGLAKAYGYKNGVANAIPGGDHKDQSSVVEADFYGNPMPYLTSLRDGVVKWVTVATPHGNDKLISRVFLTDAGTGKTEIWNAPKGREIMSNKAAMDLVRSIPMNWGENRCCDSEGYEYYVAFLRATEPRPMFKDGRFFYLVSIMKVLNDGQPGVVRETVVVDAQEKVIAKRFDHNVPGVAAEVHAYFNPPPAPTGAAPAGS